MQHPTTRLVQVSRNGERRIALVDEPRLVLLDAYPSVYALCTAAIEGKTPLRDLIATHRSADTLGYHEVYSGRSDWRLLPSFDAPHSPFACLVSGTGLTHKNSALNRQMMHDTGDKPTDSLVMYQWGVEGGNPPPGRIGVQPEWFYKGNGSVLTAHGDELWVPAFADDGGDEPEIAGVYLVDRNGTPHRIGFTTGNEFSDHVMEKKNYLYLAPSKLRSCAIGPELVIDVTFEAFTGRVSVSRGDEETWSADIHSGEGNMAHNLANLEYHHFKYPGHRIPGQAHVHFFGADAFSFGSAIRLADGDRMHVYWEGLGRPLVNTLRISTDEEQPIGIKPI